MQEDTTNYLLADKEVKSDAQAICRNEINQRPPYVGAWTDQEEGNEVPSVPSLRTHECLSAQQAWTLLIARQTPALQRGGMTGLIAFYCTREEEASEPGESPFLSLVAGSELSTPFG